MGGLEWLRDQEERLMHHPFLSASPIRPSIHQQQQQQQQATVTRKRSLYRAPLMPDLDEAPSYASETARERQRADDASRLLERAEADHAVASREISSLRQRVAELEAAKERAETIARDEEERRKRADAAARKRAKDLADQRWRADDVERALRRAEADCAAEHQRLADRDSELARLEVRKLDLDRALGDKAAAEAREAVALRAAASQKRRADDAEDRAAEAFAELEALKVKMKQDLDAEHARGEKAKDVIKARAERDRERARVAEVAAAEKAQELLQLWQRFKLFQSSEESNKHVRLSSRADNEEDATALTQRDALRLKIIEARRGLESSQRKLSERGSSRRPPTEDDDHHHRDGFVTPPPLIDY